MVDNVAITGAVVASDDVGGVQYQRVKLDGGGDGVSLPLVATTIVPDTDAPGLPVREIGQRVWSAGFSATQATLDSSFVELFLGSGVTRSQTGSNLVINAGTTANAEFLARSAMRFNGSMLCRVRSTLSQRIINNNFSVMLADRVGEGLTYTNTATTLTVTLAGHGFDATNIGQSICAGGINATTGAAVPGRYPIASITDANTIVLTVAGWTAGGGTLSLFGRSYVRVIYQGITATALLIDAASKGWSDTQVTSASVTTAAPGHMLQMHLDGRTLIVADTLVASATTPNVTVRASRYEYVPDDTTQLYLYVWSANGSTAPVSSTAWTIGSAVVETFANQPVYIAGNRPLGNSFGLPVNVSNTANVAPTTGANLIGDVGVQYRSTVLGSATVRNIVSAATTNATSVKATVGRLLGWQFANTSAAFKFVKLHNTAAAPTVGAGVVLTIAIPPNGVAALNLEGGIGFATGIGLSITGASADTDTTAVAAGDVVGALLYV